MWNFGFKASGFGFRVESVLSVRIGPRAVTNRVRLQAAPKATGYVLPGFPGVT